MTECSRVGEINAPMFLPQETFTKNSDMKRESLSIGGALSWEPLLGLIWKEENIKNLLKEKRFITEYFMFLFYYRIQFLKLRPNLPSHVVEEGLDRLFNSLIVYLQPIK